MCDEFDMDTESEFSEEASDIETEFSDDFADEMTDLTQDVDDGEEDCAEDELFDDFFADETEDSGGYDLDRMSLDELRELRNEVTGERTAALEEIEDVTKETDSGYHWDGGPTHNVEWDDTGDETPDIKTRVLKR